MKPVKGEQKRGRLERTTSNCSLVLKKISTSPSFYNGAEEWRHQDDDIGHSQFHFPSQEDQLTPIYGLKVPKSLPGDGLRFDWIL